MTASVADSDYVHQLTKGLKVRYQNNGIEVTSGVPFEQTFASFDLDQSDESVNFKPDLIIMRIAENTDVTNESIFEDRYGRLIKRLLSKSVTAKVICTTSFWPEKYQATNVVRTVASKNDYMLVDLGVFFQDISNTVQGFSRIQVYLGTQVIKGCVPFTMLLLRNCNEYCFRDNKNNYEEVVIINEM